MDEKKRASPIWSRPWQWNRWTWAVILPLALVAYFLSAVPVTEPLRHHFMLFEVADIVDGFYEPVFFCARNSDAADAIIQWEFRFMYKIMGWEQGGGF